MVISFSTSVQTEIIHPTSSSICGTDPCLNTIKSCLCAVFKCWVSSILADNLQCNGACHPGSHHWGCYPGAWSLSDLQLIVRSVTLIFFIYRYPIFKSVAETRGPCPVMILLVVKLSYASQLAWANQWLPFQLHAWLIWVECQRISMIVILGSHHWFRLSSEAHTIRSAISHWFR